MGIDTVFYIVAAAAAGAGYKAQRQAAGEQKKSRRAQRAQNELQARRQRIQQVREARLKRAAIANQAAQTGVQDSSGAAGAGLSVTSQLGSNQGFLQRTQAFSNEISRRDQNAADDMSRANTFNTISNLSLQGASIFQGSGTKTETKTE